MKFLIVLAVVLIGYCSTTTAQSNSFKLLIEPISIPGLPGVQSFAYGRHNDKWLIIGGRIDGLHRRQPFASFSPKGNNIQLTVIDPVQLKTWSAPLTSLPIALQEQLSSTNMQFHQEGNYLYLTGGYGYSASIGDHITYPNLSAIDVPATIDAIVNEKPFASFMRQVKDGAFCVTGGQLRKLNDTYYLVGGHKFNGRYNPMGPDHGPGFEQQYTDQVRKFTLSDDGTTIQVVHQPPITDAAAFHRRDYNLVPQIFPDGSTGLMLFSGVFQPDADIPFINSVSINGNGYTINPNFAQYYSHYQSAFVPMYSETTKTMHTLFFGGIAQYYDSAGVLVQNSDVPFVKTISCVTRNQSGQLAEYLLPITMPALLGAGAEFIPANDIPMMPHDIVKLDALTSDTSLLGYIYGGIKSSAANIFWINTGVESQASSQLYKVFLLKTDGELPGVLNQQSINGLQLQLYADIDAETLTLRFTLPRLQEVQLEITDAKKKVITREILTGLKAGENTVLKAIRKMKPGSSYWITVITGNITATQQLIIEP